MKLRITPFLHENINRDAPSRYEAGIEVTAFQDDDSDSCLSTGRFTMVKDVLTAETDDRFEVDFKDFLSSVGWEGDFDFLLTAIRNGFPAFERMIKGI